MADLSCREDTMSDEQLGRHALPISSERAGQRAQPVQASRSAEIGAAPGDPLPRFRSILRRFTPVPDLPNAAPLTTLRTVLFILSLSAVLWILVGALVLSRLGPLLLTLGSERTEGFVRLFSAPFSLLLLAGLALTGALVTVQRRVQSLVVALAICLGVCLFLAPVIGSAFTRLWHFWALMKELGS
jgi:hypothetical protein